MTDKKKAAPKLKKPSRRAVDAQEDTVAALYAFASRIGAPIQGPDGYEILGRRAHLGETLAEIAHAYGYEVAEIQ